MTTAAQVKNWLRPLLSQRDNLVLRQRMLVMRPVRHVLRRMYFHAASWDKNHPKPYWYIDFLPSPPFWRGHPWSDEIWGGYATDADFQAALNSRVTDIIECRFDKITSIEAFLAKAQGDPRFAKIVGQARLKDFAAYHGPVLAAAGELVAASMAIDNRIASSEQAHLAELTEAKRLIAKRSNSRLGRAKFRSATEYLDLLGQLKTLSALCKSGNRAAIGDLLRQWELHNLTDLGLADLWEPAPYPVELYLGDPA